MKLSRQSDFELISRVALRDCEAASQLFDRHSNEIYGYLTRRVGPTDAEDSLQEVFVRALRRASTFRGDSTARTWLFGIARIVLLERRRDRFFRTGVEETAESGPGPESQLILGERATQLLVALESLPDDQAIVFELHQIDGMRHEEIAKFLNIRVAASRKRLQRATEAVQGLLAKGPRGKLPRHHHVDSWARSLQLRMLASDSTP